MTALAWKNLNTKCALANQPYTSTTPPNSNVAKITASSNPAQCDICDVIAMRPAAFALWLAETQVGATI